MSDCPGAQWNYANAKGMAKQKPTNNGFNGKQPLEGPDKKAEELDRIVKEKIDKYTEETGRRPSESMIDNWYMEAARSINGKQL